MTARAPRHSPLHTSSTLARWTLAMIAMTALAALACSTSTGATNTSDDFKLGFQKSAQPGPNEPTSTPQNTPASYVPASTSRAPAPAALDDPPKPEEPSTLQRAQHDLGTIPAPTAVTLRRAEQAGLPQLKESQQIAGPFDGPQNSVFYMNPQGLVSFYLPDYHAAYFAQARPFRWIYGISMAGYFAFDQNNNYLELAEAPEQLLAWPMAYPIAEQVATFAHAYIEENQRIAQGAAPTKGFAHRNLDELSIKEQQIFWDAMDQTAKMMHDTNMSIIEHIGGQGCVSHYEDSRFLGCY